MSDPVFSMVPLTIEEIETLAAILAGRSVDPWFRPRMLPVNLVRSAELTGTARMIRRSVSEAGERQRREGGR
jgi:hypothetical protein